MFRTFDERLFALSNRDPYSGAYVLARGIVGTRGGLPTVASPMYKQVFDLHDRPLPGRRRRRRADVSHPPQRRARGGGRIVSDGPLAGFTVGITAARRHEELAALLERRGARVVYAPAIRLVPLADDAELLRRDPRVLAEPVDDIVVTTGIGFRAWLEAAEGWGMRDALTGRLTAARILARGPKARGAVRAAGLERGVVAGVGELRGGPAASAAARTSPAGGSPFSCTASRLRGSPARSGGPAPRSWRSRCTGGRGAEDSTPLRRLVGQAVAGAVDAITFTSAPAVLATLAVAADDGVEEVLLSALRGPWSPRASGRSPRPRWPNGVSGDPPGARPARCPRPRPRRGAAGAAVRAGRGRRATHWSFAGTPWSSTGGSCRSPAPRWRSCGHWRAGPGHVVSRADLCGVLPSRPLPGSAFDTRRGPDEHAVEMAVARLRRGLGPHRLVETVVKRGYRLACDPAE